MAVNIHLREGIERALRNCFYAEPHKIRDFIGRLPENESIAKVGEKISEDLVAVAEKAVIGNDSDHSPSEGYLGLQRIEKYGRRVLKAVVERICETDDHGFCRQEALTYVDNLKAA